ncbi:MAG TPA: trypsin-like peptidase domain-containing protein [Roseiflexaceae bacterium]|nr:trypsin-like peptidase domain-containing protein [Roseiflexaceae bacterium]
MTAIATPEPAGIALGDLISPALTAMITRLRPSVVQVRSGRRGAGAGVIWQADGGILTNDHVIAASRGEVRVDLPDGRSLSARVSARNPALDLALLRVDEGDLPAAPVGDSARLRVGELVFAIGHPWGQRDVVTAGIVSGTGEVATMGGQGSAQYIRSDVRLAPGNSGGPLLNTRGEVVGINAMIFGGDLSVAIPSHVAAEWLRTGLAGDRPRLGVQVQPAELPASIRQGNLGERSAGLLVVGVISGGAAEHAGLLIGDLLLEAGDTALESSAALLQALARSGPTLAVRLVRGGTISSVEVKLEA